jgi:hypothetical protein
MIREIRDGRRVSPAEMETCQEALSVAYALLRRYPGEFLGKRYESLGEEDDDVVVDDDDDVDDDANEGSPLQTEGSLSETEGSPRESTEPSSARGSRACASVVLSLYRGLQGTELSREACVSAGVAIAAAVGAGVTDDPKRHAACLADAFFSDWRSLAPREEDRPRDADSQQEDDEDDEEEETWCFANGYSKPSPLDSVALLPHSATTCLLETRKVTLFGRISLIRGALTAASAEALSAELTSPAPRRGESPRRRETKWSFLPDAAVPFLCGCMENPVDAHHKYHAAAALKAALLRIKASISLKRGSGCALLECVSRAFPADLARRVSRILWANWEDPLSQTVKEIQLSFECVLDIEETRGGEGSSAFLKECARSLLRKDASRKGRYVPLAAIARRLGATGLLDVSETLLEETLAAMKEDSVCTAAGTFLAAVARSLLHEPVSGGGGGGGGGLGSATLGGPGGSGIVIIRYPLEAA